MSTITIWIEIFSGLGLFLFGMLYLEEQIKITAGRSFKQIIQKMTSTRFKSLLTGVSTTAIFQSSSVVTLMALSFIGAGLMQLESAIAIILGSNIGTTMTAWIMALVGFKMDIKLIAYVMIGIGGLGSVLLSQEKRWKNYFGMMVGFGLIFLGLEGMKDGFDVFSKQFDLSSYLFTNPYAYALIGLVITAIIQSSSASIAIIQSALFTHMIGFEAAAAFVIGSNIGTTITAILGTIGGNSDKKRAALAHFIFNVSTGIVALVSLSWILILINTSLPDSDDVIKIALFHTFFNLLGVVLWYPFIPLLASWVQHFFKKEPIYVTQYIHKVSAELPDIALETLEKEIENLSIHLQDFTLLAINIPPPKAYEKGISIDKLLEQYHENFDLNYEKLYEKIRLLEGEIYRYISVLSAKSNTVKYQAKLVMFSRQVTYLATAAKAIKDMLLDLDRLYSASSNEEQTYYKNLRYQILKSVLAYHDARNGNASAVSEMESAYKKIAESYKNSMNIIQNIAKNPHIPSEMTAITINDMHLTKSFSKSLLHVLNSDMEL